MHFFELKHRKKGFRLHEEQNSNGTNDNFGDGETGVLRVIIYIYTLFRSGFSQVAPMRTALDHLVQ